MLDNWMELIMILSFSVMTIGALGSFPGGQLDGTMDLGTVIMFGSLAILILATCVRIVPFAKSGPQLQRLLLGWVWMTMIMIVISPLSDTFNMGPV